MRNHLETHLVQSSEWGEFKALMGTPPIKTGDIQFTKHQIPLIPYYVGYAPRVNFLIQKFSWAELKDICKDEKVAFVRFDVPNVLKPENEKTLTSKVLQDLQKHCKQSPRDTFAKWNVILDTSQPEDVLTSNLKSKTRYNCRLAARKGVKVKIENNEKGIQIFNKLHKETAKRQGFLPHPEYYYQKAFETFNAKDKAYILVAYYNKEPLVAWMLFVHGRTLYYPYGGSSTKHRNLMASNLVGWEAIKLGKRLGCTLFDMWGATNDKDNPRWGFTHFKLGYGGELVEYIDSYDFVLNPIVYATFNMAYGAFWKLAKLAKRG